MNVAQKESLDSYIAGNGIYLATIIDNEIFDLGTKILYLERAISQDCDIFNKSLDKLYSEDFVNGEKEDCVEFIRSLKSINDLCFNNEVKYSYYTPTALNHYFGCLGSIDADDFQIVIRRIINTRISSLIEGHQDQVIREKQARLTAEDNIDNHTGWRAELDLPLAQLAIHIADNYPHNVHQFILAGNITPQQIDVWGLENVTMIANTAIDDRVAPLLVSGAITLSLIRQWGRDSVMMVADTAVEENVVRLLANGTITLSLIRQWGRDTVMMVADTAVEENVVRLLANGLITLSLIRQWGHDTVMMVADTALEENVARLLANGTITLSMIRQWGQSATVQFANEQNTRSPSFRPSMSL